jgi:hypothetical protein
MGDDLKGTSDPDVMALSSALGLLAERYGKLILPVSVLLYVVGFVIVVAHFHRGGVPVQVLGHTQFLGAALLYVFFAGLPIMEGRYAARRGQSGRIVAQACVVALFFSLWGAAPVPLALYSLAMSGGAWLIHAVDAWTAKKGAAQTPVYSPYNTLIWPLVLHLSAMMVFTGSVYPQIPQLFGGGRGRPVEVTWAAGDPVREHIQGRAVCWRLQEVLADKDFLYVALRVWPRPPEGCPEEARLTWQEKWLGVGPGKSVPIVLPRAAAARVLYPRTPGVWD